MKLLWITAVYPSANSPAEGVFHRTQAEALTRLGVKVQVVAPVPWIPAFLSRMRRRWNSYSEYPSRYEQNGVEVFRPKFFAHPRHFFHGIPHRFMARAVNGLNLPAPELIHAHFAFPCGLAASHVSCRVGVPYVLTLHGSDVHSYPMINRRCRRRFLRAVNGASSVMAVGDTLARTAHGIAGIRPHVRPIGVHLNNFKNLPNRHDARRTLGLPTENYVVLYVGRLVEAKGIRELTDALGQKFPRPVTALLVGDGPLERQVKSVGQKQREERRSDGCTATIQAVGPVDNKRLPLYFAAADALILPSYNEGLPTVLVEAGASGVPVIATNVPGVIDLVGSDRAHLIEPKSPAAIVAAITHLINNPLYAESIARKLQQHVFQHYDAEKNARNVVALYETTLATREQRQHLHSQLAPPLPAQGFLNTYARFNDATVQRLNESL